MRFACVSYSHPVGATVEKPIPILSCTDLGIMSQSCGDFSLEDLRINRNLSLMLGHLAATCGGEGGSREYGFSAMVAAWLHVGLLVGLVSWSVNHLGYIPKNYRMGCQGIFYRYLSSPGNESCE